MFDSFVDPELASPEVFTVLFGNLFAIMLLLYNWGSQSTTAQQSFAPTCLKLKISSMLDID